MDKKWIWFVLFGTASVLSAKPVQVLDLRPFRRLVLAEQGFVVSKDLSVRIKAVGSVYRDKPDAYAWILEKKSRDVVWSMIESASEYGMGSFKRKVDREVRFPKGEYELYYAALPSFFRRQGMSQGSFWELLFQGWDDMQERDLEKERWGVELWVDETEQENFISCAIEDANSDLVHLSPLGDDESEEESFSIPRETRIRILVVGEGSDEEMSDYGWIVREGSDEEVWTMEYEDTRWAGGAEKNRMVDETITLPAGNYTVHFVTDDSHSYSNWNALPPLDPRRWGVVLRAVDHAEGTPLMLKLKKSEEPDSNVLVQLIRIGNDRLESEKFILIRPAQIRIECLGELGHDDHFVDYGWILDARTRKPVWEMQKTITRHAGGAQKNRMFNGTVSFDPGTYEAYYRTDDSHAYRDWNAGPPRNPDAWGITVRAEKGGFKSRAVLSERDESDRDILAECVRVGNDAELSKSFILDEPTGVLVYALGEGKSGDLFDYGWIENRHGEKVWKMKYADTQQAGGARKNRMVNETIQLPAGKYSVHYRTDDSHAYDDWNDDPPWDPLRWGITVSRVQSKP